MSVSVDNFLKNVYLLNQETGSPVTSSHLAGRLEISVAAVTDMARKLGAQGLLDYRPYKALTLMPAGKEVALKIVRKHRLWELFLYEVLKMDLMSVHEEAEKLEHHTSDDLMEHINRFLGHPDFDPHGDPIPGIGGRIPSEKGVVLLREIGEEEACIVAKLRYRNAETSEMYDRFGLKKGIRLKVVRMFPFDGSIEVEFPGGREVVLSEKLAQNIFCIKQ
ncbi:metal-dependent transcriptional regulator [Marinilabilia sp.]|uniref:metal-dependent transcriptional regulator n=1 Tax=Marinilabilia sp. TaxID=2021252 RepID=UPI0025BDFA56|nr:metal-dependent transcriptional regulator [Marinilabilia sp.]